MPLQAKFGYPTAIRLQCGVFKQLVSIAKEFAFKKPLYVVDSYLLTLPVVQEMLELSARQGLGNAVFSNFKGNPTEQNLTDGISFIKTVLPDSVIAIGGGSALDIAKLLGFYYKQTRPIWDFEDIGDYWTRADSSVILPNIAVPTTSGTGSEVGRAAVVTKADTQDKIIIFHPLMMPKVVVADPELTKALPSNLTAWTGMDAFIHCLEAYCAPFYHPLSRGVAIEGMRTIAEFLPKVFKDPNDLDARAQMMMGSIMGGTAFQKGLGGIHALSHPTGALFDTHHGLTNAVYLPYVLKRNYPAIETLIDQICPILGCESGKHNFLDWILTFRSSLSIPHTLKEINVDRSKDQLIITKSPKDPSASGNPIPFTELLAEQILHDAHNGTI
ncbi:MAG: iron-containing alcohol dehydrogenase [Methylacidiphilales bacterium]|nr:iron-containing alcohol dehydrogenase [Candidatus Methylacidiphilales bacterium]